MKLKILILVTLVVLILTGCSQREYRIVDARFDQVSPVDNYRVFYQIFVGSFSDSNNDTIGDIRGIINRLDYLNDGDPLSGKSLGVTGLWLTPIMPSPSYHKYDTTDYFNVDPQFGTLEDFQELIIKAEARGINIIIDLVLNHTSSRHPWFVEARRAMREGDLDNRYIDFYNIVRAEEKVAGRTYYHFYGEYYYEGNFWSEMPDLNVSNLYVREEIERMVEFWLGMGVAGFRLDAVKYPFLGNDDANLEFWRWFMDIAKSYREDVYVVGEMWDSDTNILRYYEVMNNFDFGMSQSNGAVASTVQGIESVNQFVRYVYEYRNSVKAVNPDAMLQPFLTNHDMNRAAGFLSLENGQMQMAANLYILSYGTPFIYYGEEIGMRGSRGSENTDANRRLAMHWGDGDSVGNPIGSTWTSADQTNGTVREQLRDPDSLLTHYKRLLLIRQANPEIARGEYLPLMFENEQHFGGFLSTYEGSTIAVLHNVSQQPITIDISIIESITLTELRAEIGMGGATLTGSVLVIDPMTSVVLR